MEAVEDEIGERALSVSAVGRMEEGVWPRTPRGDQIGVNLRHDFIVFLSLFFIGEQPNNCMFFSGKSERSLREERVGAGNCREQRAP